MEQYEVSPAGKYACIIFDDNSFSKEKYYKVMVDFIKENGLKSAGDFIEEWIMPRVEEKKRVQLLNLKLW